MFGSNYYKHPEILLDSFWDLSSGHKKKKIKNASVFFSLLQQIYLYIFGVPEIGFQLRSLYFRQMLGSNIRGKRIKKILDAGSGIGAYAFWLSEKYKNSSVTGGEIDKNKLEFTKQFSEELNLKNINFSYLNLEKEVSKNNYDLVVSIDVLEHINNYKKVLRNFYKLIYPNGYLFIHTPQINQRRIFKQLQNWHHEEHVHEGFSSKELREELKKTGFTIVEIRETFGFFGKLSWELNHIILPKGFILLGITYPFLYLIAKLDLLTKNKEGLGTAILARRNNEK